jgi:hypothetical protein
MKQRYTRREKFTHTVLITGGAEVISEMKQMWIVLGNRCRICKEYEHGRVSCPFDYVHLVLVPILRDAAIKTLPWTVHCNYESCAVGLHINEFQSEVKLRMTASRPVHLSAGHLLGSHVQHFNFLIFDFFFHVGRPLWREDRSVVFSAITQWSRSHRTRYHALLCYLRLPQPWRPEPRT